MAFTEKERGEILAAARLINLRAKYLDAPVSAVPGKSATALLDEEIPRKGGRTGVTTLRNVVSYSDVNLDKANDDAGTAGVPEAGA